MFVNVLKLEFVGYGLPSPLLGTCREGRESQDERIDFDVNTV